MSRFLASCCTMIFLAAMVPAADDAKATVAKLDETWLDAYKAADFDRLAALYAEDAMVMPAFSEPVQGREAIRDFFESSVKDVPRRSMALKSFRVEASGVLITDSGEYIFDGVNTEGKPLHIVGNYITVFKNTEGKWRTATEIWNVRTPEERKESAAFSATTGKSTADSGIFHAVRPGTMSIIARDPQTGQMGVAVESHYFSVGPLAPWAEAGIGAIATQATGDPLYGKLGLEMMRYGKNAPDVLKALLAADSEREVRQVAMIDARGNVAAHTGSRNTFAAGHLIGKNYSVQANTMSNEKVWPAMAKAFEDKEGDLTDRLLAGLEAGQKMGGDIRGQQTAAIVVVSGTPTGKAWQDRIFDLRVEDSPEPIVELKRLVRLQRAYRFALQGDDFANDKDWKHTVSSYRKAVELAPEKEELRYGLATVLFLAGSDEESLPIFRQVFREYPVWAEITKRNVKSGDLPNDPVRIQRILDQAGVR